MIKLSFLLLPNSSFYTKSANKTLLETGYVAASSWLYSISLQLYEFLINKIYSIVLLST